MSTESTPTYKIPEVYAANTDVGCVREHNEDSFIAAAPLFVVADGMGGHECGEVASEIAINILSANAPDHPDGDALIQAVRLANTAILQGVEQGLGRPGMGTTVTCAQVFDDQLFVAQVGDSRAYLLHDGRLQRITRDHSLVQDLIDQGRITEEEARIHPQRSVITRALGSDATVEPDLYVLRLTDGDRILLCSDGLSGMIDDATIEAILAKGHDAYRTCDVLISEALAAGGSDNVTAVVIDPFKKMPKEQRRRKTDSGLKKHIGPLVWAIALVVVLVGAGIGVFAYAKSNYYVIAEDGYVTVYQGLPGKVGPFTLHWLSVVTDIPVSSLEESTAQRLEEGQAVGDYDSAMALLDDYLQQTGTVVEEAPAQ